MVSQRPAGLPVSLSCVLVHFDIVKGSILRNASVFAAAAVVCLTSAVHGNPIYGGPTYNSTTGTGFQFAGLPTVPGSTAGNGVGVGYESKFTANTNLGVRAIRWNTTSTAELGTLGTDVTGFTSSEAFSVNTAGTAIGFATKFTSGTNLGQRAVRWAAPGTAATELGNLGTDSSGNSTSFAYSINTVGTAVGYATKYTAGSSLGPRTVRWAASGTASTELGNLGTTSGGVSDSLAYVISPSGTAIGYANKYTAGVNVGQRAVAWNGDGAAIDLNKLLSSADATQWTLTAAKGISGTNWITSLGTYDPDATGPLAAYSRTFLIKLGYGGDADLNDKVDFNDFLILQNNFGHTGTTFSEGDFNYDGKTDFNDFLILQNTFGSTLNTAVAVRTPDEVAALTAFGLAHAVPEPTVLAEVAIGSLGLMRRRLPIKL